MRCPHRVGHNDEPAGRSPSPGTPLQSQERNKGIRGTPAPMGGEEAAPQGGGFHAGQTPQSPLRLGTSKPQDSQGRTEAGVETHAEISLPWISSGLW